MCQAVIILVSMEAVLHRMSARVSQVILKIHPPGQVINVYHIVLEAALMVHARHLISVLVTLGTQRTREPNVVYLNVGTLA